MERMDEARRVFDVVVEEMNEDQERKHREILNESTEMLPFYGLTRIDGAEEQKVEAGEDNQQEILTPLGKMNTGRDTEGELYSAKKGGEKTPRREQKAGKGQMISTIMRRGTPRERSQVVKS